MINLKQLFPKKAAPVWVVPGGAVVAGDLNTPRSLRIDGMVTGNVSAGERLLVGATGQVNGNIEGDYVMIQGKVRGNVRGGAKVHIAATAQIEGLISAPETEIREGAAVTATDAGPAASMQVPVQNHQKAAAPSLPKPDIAEVIEKIWTPVRPVNNNTWF